MIATKGTQIEKVLTCRPKDVCDKKFGVDTRQLYTLNKLENSPIMRKSYMMFKIGGRYCVNDIV